MTKVIALEKRVEYEPGDILALFDPETFTPEKLSIEIKKDASGSQLTDDKINELFNEDSVETWFGEFVLNYMEIL